MIEEIKRRLENGERVELECVDRDGFLGAHCRNQSILKVGRLVVSDIDDVAIFLENCFPGISPEEYQYFRIKRYSPTFDDLIDVAVKAVKDKVLFTMSIGDSRRKGRYLNYTVSGSSPSESFYENDGCHQSAINFINSLYTETFVIESEKDMNSCKEGCKIIFANGAEGEFSKYHESVSKAGILFTNTEDWFNIPFELLKGATVTQKRGKQ